MGDMLSFVMLVCAVIGAMAFGILLAYAILRAGFSLMRRPQRVATTTVKASPEAA